MAALRPLQTLLVVLLVVGSLVVPVAGSGPVTDTDPVAADHTVDPQVDAERLTVRSSPTAVWSQLDSVDAIRRAVSAGRLPTTDRVAVGDPLVLVIENGTLATALGDGNATSAFFERHNESAVVDIEQYNPSPMRAPKRVTLQPTTTRVVVDSETNTTFVVVDTGRLAVSRDDGTVSDDAVLEDGDELGVRVVPSATMTAADDSLSPVTTFRIVERVAGVFVDDDRLNRLYRAPTDGQSVSGLTNLAVGSNVTVVVRGDPETGPRESPIERVEATVVARPDADADDRYPTQFEARLDLSDVAPNTTTTVEVRFDDRRINRSAPTMRVVGRNASLSVRETVSPVSADRYPAVQVDTSLSRGGFVVLHRGSPTGLVAGVSGYLPPGDHENVTVYVGTPTDASSELVAVVHRDAGYDHWFADAETDTPYATNGSAVARTGFAPTLPATTPAPTATSTPTPTATPTGTPGDHTPAPRTTTTTPGFGVVAGLLALCGAALLFARR